MRLPIKTGLFASFTSIVLLAACQVSVGSNTTANTPSDDTADAKPNDDADADADADVDVDADVDADADKPDRVTSKPALPTGKACSANTDCGPGAVCEGMGCGDNEGRCVSTEGRMCTRDLVEYCGCDDKTFKTSGSCAGARYLHYGACSPKLAEGETCTAGAQCDSGLCQGEGLEGCGRDATGTCAAKATACTTDLAAFCGCNNFTFRGSGSCPDQQYAYRGECESSGG